jgi:hypothetical protein
MDGRGLVCCKMLSQHVPKGTEEITTKEKIVGTVHLLAEI